MALINREQALSHPFANGQYDKEHADEHFIMGFEDYKEWLEDLPTVEAISKVDYEAKLKADMAAILTELKTEIEEVETFKNVIGWELTPKTPTNIKQDCIAIIQDKINKLKADQEGKE